MATRRRGDESDGAAAAAGAAGGKRSRTGTEENTEAADGTAPTPYARLPPQSLTPRVAVLVVGSVGTGKRTLGTLLVKAAQARSVTVDVRTAAQLPLPVDRSGRRPRIDLVVFAVDLTSALSYAQLRTNVLGADADYLLGRACVVATHAEKVGMYALDARALEQLSFDLELPLLFSNLTDGGTGSVTADQVLTLALTASRWNAGLSPLLMRSASSSYVETTVVAQ